MAEAVNIFAIIFGVSVEVIGGVEVADVAGDFPGVVNIQGATVAGG